jgi:SAM-dependent methyltransferase
MIDWSIGSYERTAALLDTVSDTVVAQAAIVPGENVLDIACGTGNAALKAATLGAQVVGVDLAPRLVQVASDRAAGTGLTATFMLGDAQWLPVQDASADVVLSVFGLIFAPDQERAAAEVARVLRSGGRALVTGWVREGALAEAGAATAQARAAHEQQATDADPPPPGRTPVDWGDEATVRALFAPHRVRLGFTPAAIAFTAASPEAYAEEQSDHHPLWLDARATIGEAAYAALQERLIAIFRAGNEDPAAFRVTSRYLITTIVRA